MDEITALRVCIERLEALRIADSLVLRALVRELFDNPELRRQRRDELCQHIEGLYEAGVTKGGHLSLQIALHAVEELFRLP